MVHKALFISNINFLNDSTKEGGVRVCTQEYLSLIKNVFNVVLFPVEYEMSLIYRIRVKLGLNIYHDYKPEIYALDLINSIKSHNIKVVFLNLGNTSTFSKIVKDAFGDSIQIVLCSHGNESGDFLHDITRFSIVMPWYKKLLSSFAMGNMLKKEVLFRHNYIDGVLTVSNVEVALEKWLGAKKVMMVFRTITPDPIEWNPKSGCVGFIGDLSHSPNRHGITEVCEAIKKLESDNIDLRIVGSPQEIGNMLADKYSFVTYVGYLDQTKLLSEVSNWSFFLNPVFYYSRGVSTKFAKALSWGLPIITTTIGYRGYDWKEGNPIIANNPADMAKVINDGALNMDMVYQASNEIKKMVATSPTLDRIGIELKSFIGIE